jgi:hypothetical protein
MRAMRPLSAALCAVGLLLPLFGHAQQTPSELRTKLGGKMNFSFVGEYPGSGKLVLMGTIDAAMASYFKLALAADPAIRTVLIDSYGGDIDSAMDMAALMRERKLRLVVDGRCLSACANYLFPAAASKTVLPGSVVAIHGLSYDYQDGDKPRHLSLSQAVEVFRSAPSSADRDVLARSLAREAAFNRQLGLSSASHDAFKVYLAHRKQVLGTDLIDASQRLPGCPPFQMWALDKAQLEAMGVRGIEGFWYPAKREQESLLSNLDMPPEFFYYGPAAQLKQLCTQAPPLRLRLARWLSSFKAAFYQ